MKYAKLASGEVVLTVSEGDLKGNIGISFPIFHLKKSYWEETLLLTISYATYRTKRLQNQYKSAKTNT